MILIADGGSTKTDWALVEGCEVVSLFSSRGMNPYNVSDAAMKREIEEKILPNINPDEVEAVYIYASGCSAQVKQQV